MIIEAAAQNAFSSLIGKSCCRQRVGAYGSLSIGFGDRVAHSQPRTADPFYGEWELGTYSAAWRIIRKGHIVCGSLDLVDSTDELDKRLQAVELGALLAIEAVSPFDIRVKLTNDLHIDFICAAEDDDDEMFHIFGPANLYVEYKCLGGWKVGTSNEPWR